MLELSGAAHDRMTLSYGGDNLNTADYLAQPNVVCVEGKLGGRCERHGQ